MLSTSQRFSISWPDVWKSVRTMLTVGAASIVMYFLSDMLPGIITHIPATYSIIVIPIISFVAEFLRRWATNYAVA